MAKSKSHKSEFVSIIARPSPLANTHTIGRVTGAHARGTFPVQAVGFSKSGELILELTGPETTGLYLVRTFYNPGGWKTHYVATAWNAGKRMMAMENVSEGDAKLIAAALANAADPTDVLYWDESIGNVNFSESANAKQLALESSGAKPATPAPAESEPNVEMDSAPHYPDGNPPEPPVGDYEPAVDEWTPEHTAAIERKREADGEPVPEFTSVTNEREAVDEPTQYEQNFAALWPGNGEPPVDEPAAVEPPPAPKKKREPKPKAPKPAPAAPLPKYDVTAIRNAAVPTAEHPIAAIEELMDIRGTPPVTRSAVMACVEALYVLGADALADARSIIRQLQPRKTESPLEPVAVVPGPAGEPVVVPADAVPYSPFDETATDFGIVADAAAYHATAETADALVAEMELFPPAFDPDAPPDTEPEL